MRPDFVFRSALPLAVCAAFAGAAAFAQAAGPLIAALPNGAVAAALPRVSSTADSSPLDSSTVELPEAPEVALAAAAAGDGQAGTPSLTASPSQIAPKYSGIILPGQSAQPLTAGNKVTFGFVQAVSPFNIVAWAFSAAYSQAVDSAPHYGQGWGPFGERYGAAAARGTIQTLATDSLFAPVFHDDPRYYELGRQHKVINRAIYAASRVVVTRSDSGQQRINAPLLVGYAVAAGASNAFYPDRDRTGKQTAETYGASLGGAALGLLFNEFLDDGLRIAHLRK